MSWLLLSLLGTINKCVHVRTCRTIDHFHPQQKEEREILAEGQRQAVMERSKEEANALLNSCRT